MHHIQQLMYLTSLHHIHDDVPDLTHVLLLGVDSNMNSTDNQKTGTERWAGASAAGLDTDKSLLSLPLSEPLPLSDVLSLQFDHSLSFLNTGRGAFRAKLGGTFGLFVLAWTSGWVGVGCTLCVNVLDIRPCRRL